ncbi:MAG: FtsX-like permease family protein [Chitinivibrionales bacterium]|nr:FtsX-like permease family protein [Chitinivibrionales bacterium]
MKPITVKDQVKLGPKRCFELSLSGMYYRLTRSAITVSILSLAVAFLSYVLFFGIVAHDTEYYAWSQLQENRLIGSWISHLSSPDLEISIIENFANSKQQKIEEYQIWGNLSQSEIKQMKDATQTITDFVNYFESIAVTSQAILLGDRRPRMLFTHLDDAENMKKFAALIGQLKLTPPLGGIDNVSAFIKKDYPGYIALTRRIQNGQRKSIEALESRFPDQSLYELFASGSAEFLEAMRANGFHISKESFATIGELAQVALDMKSLKVALDNKDAKPRVARKLGIKQSEVSVPRVMGWLSGAGRAAWLQQELSANTKNDLRPRRLLSLAQRYKRTSKLQNAVKTEKISSRDGLFALPAATLWLILVSFLVCIVGITNTMTMSVTDRFAEIATMKCLGAMDGFVMLLYVFEALFQGIAGSLFGVILGFLLAIMRGALSYGTLLFESMALVDLTVITLISFVAGIIIASISATWPAWSASRLAPMEAMRVE